MKVVLLTTTVWSDRSRDVLERLVSSIRQECNHSIQVHHLILLQKWQGQSYPDFGASSHHKIQFMACSEMLSLSAARNEMLRQCQEQSLVGSEDIVAFPDDDGWYPNDTLGAVVNGFNDRPAMEFFFCKYKQSDHEAAQSIDTASLATATDVVRNASSNTLFLKGRLVNRIGGFDLELGVGAKNNGGEIAESLIKKLL